MLTTPILNDIRTFDAHDGYEFMFNVVGGSQIVGNNLVVEQIDDNAVVYNTIQEGFNFRHRLPPSVLNNGMNYRAKIRTRDINGNWSAFSTAKLFWCYSKPQLSITTIDYGNQNRVYNQTVLFETTYSQAENESMQSYRYLLYNSNKDLLNSFSEVFASGSSPLTQEIAGLENGALYYLEVKTLSPSGNAGTTGLIHFRPFYVAPKLIVTLTPENLPDQGAIKVNANIIQIIMKLYDNYGREINPLDIEYIDDEHLDMTRIDYDRLVADEGFNILQENFILQLWCKDMPDDKVFLTLFAPEGKLELIKYGSRVRLLKSIDRFDSQTHFASNVVEEAWNDIMIYIKQQDGLVDVQVAPY